MDCKKLTDVKSAFLQGKPIDRVVHLKPPPEVNSNKVWCLLKAIYGLNDASRQWYMRVLEVLIESGMQMSTLDEALFYWTSDSVLQGLIAIHVDDFFSVEQSCF